MLLHSTISLYFQNFIVLVGELHGSGKWEVGSGEIDVGAKNFCASGRLTPTPPCQICDRLPINTTHRIPDQDCPFPVPRSLSPPINTSICSIVSPRSIYWG